MNSYEKLKRAVDDLGTREVARRLKKSPAAVSQLYHNKYPNPERMYVLVEKVFGTDGEVICPVLGAIHKNVCAKYRAWSLVRKVHQDLSYRQVRGICLTCTVGVKHV